MPVPVENLFERTVRESIDALNERYTLDGQLLWLQTLPEHSLVSAVVRVDGSRRAIGVVKILVCAKHTVWEHYFLSSMMGVVPKAKVVQSFSSLRECADMFIARVIVNGAIEAAMHRFR